MPSSQSSDQYNHLMSQWNTGKMDLMWCSIATRGNELPLVTCIMIVTIRSSKSNTTKHVFTLQVSAYNVSFLYDQLSIAAWHINCVEIT